MTQPTSGSAKTLSTVKRYDAANALKNEIFKELRVCIPGQVTANNGDGTVNIQPSLMKLDAEGVSYQYSQLYNVPYITIQGGGVAISIPPVVGDCCLIFFADRCMDSWKKNQGNPAPLPNRRKHDISDGFAIVGLNPTPTMLAPAVPGEAGLIVSTAKVATVKIATMGGKITLQNTLPTPQNFNTIMQTLLTALASDPALDAGTVAAIGAAQVALAALFY